MPAGPARHGVGDVLRRRHRRLRHQRLDHRRGAAAGAGLQRPRCSRPARAGHDHRRLRGLPRPLLRGGVEGQQRPVSRSTPTRRCRAAPTRSRLRPAQPDAIGLPRAERPVRHSTAPTRGCSAAPRCTGRARRSRMLPEDFEMRTRFGAGPRLAAQLRRPRAVLPAGRARARRLGRRRGPGATSGITFPPGYVFPMRGMPPVLPRSGDRQGVDGIEVDARRRDLYGSRSAPFPQARNGVPNPDIRRRQGLRAGRRGQHHPGRARASAARATSTASRICPVQAKYNARQDAGQGARRPAASTSSPQTVASQVHVDPETRPGQPHRVQELRGPRVARHTTAASAGRVFVLAANAVENARLMLASGLPSTQRAGRPQPDGPRRTCSPGALMPEMAGTMRGPLCTGGIEDLRGGAFRRRQAAFARRHPQRRLGLGHRLAVHRPDRPRRRPEPVRRGAAPRAGRPDLAAAAARVHDRGAAEPEQPRHASTRATRTSSATCARSSPTTSPTTRCAGVAYARQLSRQIFQRLGAEDHTRLRPADYGYVTYEGEGYVDPRRQPLGRHPRHGHEPDDSVVDAHQRSWDHENLYLVGGGSMPIDRHVEHHADPRRALLPQRRAHRHDLRTATAPAPIVAHGLTDGCQP